MKQSSYVCIINLSRKTVLLKNLYQLHKPVFPLFHFPPWCTINDETPMSIKNLRPQPGSKEKFFFPPVLLWVGTPRTANPTLKPVGLTRLPFLLDCAPQRLLHFSRLKCGASSRGAFILRLMRHYSIIISLLILF